MNFKQNRTIVIAEAGVNHNGDINIAKKLINIASKSGADYVKFKTFDVDHLILKKTKTASYQKKNIKSNISQYSMLKKYQLSENSHKELIKFSKKKKITILHCTSDYPANLKDLNLNFIKVLKRFGYKVGYSDHSSSIITPSIAVSLGCKVVEKHFTLSKKLKGPDHKASLEPQELKRMINLIRDTEKILGSKSKKITKGEVKTKLLVRKSLVAKVNIRKGDILSIKNITSKRPGTGVSPFKIKKFLGKISRKNFRKDEFIK